MGKKENRPDACTASGTASTCDYDSTSVYAGQDMTENELIRTVTEDYLADIALIYVVLSFIAVMMLCRIYINLYQRNQRKKEEASHDR